MLKSFYLITPITLFILSGCGSVPINQDTQQLTTDVVAKESSSVAVDTSNYRTHNQGQDCLVCHGVSSSRSLNDEDEVEDDERFTSGATIFTKLDAAASDKTYWANNFSIRLVLENTGTMIRFSRGRGTANANAYFDAGSVNSFTAQVVNLNGDVVNSSLENSHDLSRLRCNTCHSATGSDGAPGRIVNYDLNRVDTTTTIESNATQITAKASSFSSEVMPILESRCKSCHGTFSFRTFRVKDSAGTYSNITANSLINSVTVADSLLLRKGSGAVSHDGGNALATQANYDVVQKWISEGAQNN